MRTSSSLWSDSRESGHNESSFFIIADAQQGGLPMPFLTRLLYLAYGAAIELITWLILAPWTFMRVLFKAAPRDELAQRLGRSRLALPKTGPRILIHAVSVGEMVAAGVLVGALARVAPGIQVILTSGNRHGLEAGRRLKLHHPQVREVWLLPWDRAGSLARWLGDLNPDLVAVVETEIWPNLFLCCKKLGILLCMVNGRIYPGDLAAYRVARVFFKPALDCVNRYWVQSEAEKERFWQIGADPARVVVEANLKFDAALRPGLGMDLVLFRHPVVVAGSTHPPEEEWLLEAIEPLRADFPRLLLVIAPRHPRRTRSICSTVSQKGLSVARLSEWAGRPVDSDVLILDRMGVLDALYEIADIAVIGGSLANCGGHNLLEPAARARPIVMGPHYEHFQDIVDDFRAADAFVLLEDRRQLGPALGRLLADSALRGELGRRARVVLECRAGSADRCARGLAALLNLPPDRPGADAGRRLDCRILQDATSSESSDAYERVLSEPPPAEGER